MELFSLYGFISIFGSPLFEWQYGFKTATWILWLIAAAVYIVICAFKGVGLYAMAKKQGRSKLFGICGFIPFASTYAMGELAGEFRMGNSKIKHIGLFAMLAEIILCVAYAVQDIPQSIIFMDDSLYNILVEQQGNLIIPVLEFTSAVPGALVSAMNFFSIFGTIFYFVWLLAFIFLCMAFFRSYAPASYIWMVVLCALFPVITGFLVFAFRNRSPIDYDKYMQERIRRAQQAPYGPYGPYGGNPYGGNPYGNPYGQNPYGQNGYGGRGAAPKEPDDPFGEYSSSPSPNGASSDSGNGRSGEAPRGSDPFGEYTDGQGGSGGNKNS